MEFSRSEYWSGQPSSSPGDLPKPGIKPRSPALQVILYQLSHKGSPRIQEQVASPSSSRSSQPRNQTRVSCIAGRFFTNLAVREDNGKEPACQCRKHRKCRFDPWVWKIPWRREQQHTPVFLPGESHGQRSLVGYSPWGYKESDMTEVTLHTHTHTLSLRTETESLLTLYPFLQVLYKESKHSGAWW